LILKAPKKGKLVIVGSGFRYFADSEKSRRRQLRAGGDWKKTGVMRENRSWMLR
jgi:hypothetical protein